MNIAITGANSSVGTILLRHLASRADNSELARVKSYGLLNLRAGVSGAWRRSKWSVWAWANNATDRIYTMGGLSAATATLQYAEFPGQPRTFGGTVRVEF